MGISNPPTVPSRRSVLIGAILAALVVTAAAGCAKGTPTAGATLAPPTSAPASPTPPVPPAATAGASDYCALAAKILTESGLMVNNQVISPQEETLDNLKAVVNLSLAAKDQLLTALPANVRSALIVELQYFQALKDNDFASSTPAPAGLDAAIKTVNDHGEATCGFSFDS